VTDVVYYIRRDGFIKIGVTGNFIQRMHKLRPDEVLAVEPGGRSLETARHRQLRNRNGARAALAELFFEAAPHEGAHT
jgi:hypothetical protein